MGCTNSKDDNLNLEISPDTIAYKANIGGIKMLANCEDSRDAFLLYLKSLDNMDKLLRLYLALAEIKSLDKDDLCSRTSGILWRCKSEYDDYIVYFAEELKASSPISRQRKKRGSPVQAVVWECLGRLRSTNIKNCPREHLVNLIGVTQREVLHRLIAPFEEYLKSDYNREWQQERLRKEKRKEKPTPETKFTKSDTCSNIYPHVLVVDDSPVTMKLVGRSLETDGHQVDRAINGEMALNLMKTEEYDVVLIDINMPILDGYETVQLFRQFEKLSVGLSNAVSEVSSLSDDYKYSSHGVATIATTQETYNTDPEVNVEKISFFDRTKKVAPLTSSIFSSHNLPDPFDTTLTEKLSSNLALTKENIEGSVLNMNPEFHSQFIIGMSSSVDEETRKKALACGMDYFLPKPFTIGKFMNAIRKGNKASSSWQ